MLQVDQILQNRYRIIRILGQGGMGAVYQATDSRLGIPVAIKETIPQFGLDAALTAQLKQQFHAEGMTLARLSHPNLVRVSDFFEEGSNAYLVMSFVAGESLSARIQRQGALPVACGCSCGSWRPARWARHPGGLRPGETVESQR